MQKGRCNMKTDTLYTSLIGGSMAWGAYFVGGVDHLVKAFAIFMAIDYTLGIMVGYLFKNVESKKAFDFNGHCCSTTRPSYREWLLHA